MTVEFTTKRIDNYYLIDVVGRIETHKDILVYWTPAREEAIRRGVKRFLINYEKVDFRLDYYEMVQLSNHAEKIKFQAYGCKIAIVVLPADLKKHKEYQTPALNRGFNFHSFTSELEALSWLLDG
ncbi:MAG: hypothetical protein V3571_13455 [Pseudodesulfovibrio sp.]